MNGTRLKCGFASYKPKLCIRAKVTTTARVSFHITPKYIFADNGNSISCLTRGLYWRVMLGMLQPLRPGMDVGLSWGDQLSGHHKAYMNTKSRCLLEVTKALSQDIEKDLRRLYFSNSSGSIPLDFFLVKERYDALFNVLAVWSVCHPRISYRQGMHEVCAVVMYVMELEAEAWLMYRDPINKSSTSETGLKLSCSFSLERIESFTFSIFQRLLNELGVLYDPALGSYSILHYCHRIQDKVLGDVDPDLRDCLLENEIQAPYYGLFAYSFCFR